jgi:carbon-monoxide dehydrogenase iron sulfur subunit
MKVIVVDVRRCLSCGTCGLECAVAHSQSKRLFDAIWEEPRPQPRVMVEAVGGVCVPIQCRHCEDAPCVAICPTHATSRADADAPVLIEPERCIGCKMCILVCPFGTVRMQADGKAVLKCDLCIERLEAGQEPACVAACPTGALRFEAVEQTAKAARVRAARQLLIAVESGEAEEALEGG